MRLSRFVHSPWIVAPRVEFEPHTAYQSTTEFVWASRPVEFQGNEHGLESSRGSLHQRGGDFDAEFTLFSHSMQDWEKDSRVVCSNAGVSHDALPRNCIILASDSMRNLSTNASHYFD